MKLVLFFALLLSGTANAGIITAKFDGLIDHDIGNFDPISGAHDGFGLGIVNGDPLFGSFSYDSITGAPIHLTAVVGDTLFRATNLSIGAHLFDGLRTWFYIRGQIVDGLFMSVGLTAGEPIFTTLPPMRLDSRDGWGAYGLKSAATLLRPLKPTRAKSRPFARGGTPAPFARIQSPNRLFS